MGVFFDALSAVSNNKFSTEACQHLVTLCSPNLRYNRLIKESEALTFLCEDINLMRKVILRTPSVEIYAIKASLSRFIRGGKVQAKARLRGAGVPDVHQMCVPKDDGSEDRCFIVMEYVESYALYGYMTTLKEVEEKIDFFKKILYTVKQLHDEGFIHRDLKPDNIVVKKAPSNTPYILDFGISKQEKKHTITNAIGVSGVGTPVYMAPEQKRNLLKADRRSDIYSLGKILYVILTGHILKNEKEKMDDEKIPWGWHSILQRCVEKNPIKRYQDISELLYDINEEMQPEEEMTEEEIQKSLRVTQSRTKLPANFLEMFNEKSFNIVKPEDIEECKKFERSMLLCEYNPGRLMTLANISHERYHYLLNKSISILVERIKNDNPKRDN